MTATVQILVPLVTAAGLMAAAVCLARTRRAVLALGVLVDFLIAAGLLRLTADPSWSDIALAAIVIAVRKLASVGLRVSQRAGESAREEEKHGSLTD
ncbi:DUF1622 domain-containing protein [Thermobifida halotolerans]|uniref:DUF1622 domain-containing protein n=1 Tax=Thermobifida halotolerans TaxID=483545 RepID=A0A399FV90_9ACTN|nr:DUF1622 domain-containing protein [Thermobifida halotolerans]UOE18812.1 DUF1622 domain-containing protein [Thermobifida halotolerans]